MEFVALLKNGTRVTGVWAESKGDALEQIRHELDKNESRRWYLRRWQADGEQVQVVEYLSSEAVDPASGEILGKAGDEVTEAMRQRAEMCGLRWCTNCRTFVRVEGALDAKGIYYVRCCFCNKDMG